MFTCIHNVICHYKAHVYSLFYNYSFHTCNWHKLMICPRYFSYRLKLASPEQCWRKDTRSKAISECAFVLTFNIRMKILILFYIYKYPYYGSQTKSPEDKIHLDKIHRDKIHRYKIPRGQNPPKGKIHRIGQTLIINITI